jgi:hypothetical protein
VSELEGTRIAIHVDPGYPNAWKLDPYYSEIKDWSVSALQHHDQVVVCIGKRAIVVLPHQDVDLGVVEDDDRIITVETRRGSGVYVEAMKLKADDPRLSGVTPGKPIFLKS